ncbi:MAG TPA: cytochrome-c oxidase [Opitutaceae bacterium]|nr:cytochrome-c oxidase [Opitutaceae bacterium]
MKNGPLIVIGLFAGLTISWAGIVLGTNAQLGAQTPYYDDTDSLAYPQRTSGIAVQGQMVYTDLGCASCHTEQVRRPGFGSDQDRGWGDRQSVARDYIFQPRPQLGSLRVGRDLANYGASKPDPAQLMRLLYVGSVTHPSFKFLFDNRQIVGQRSDYALDLEGSAAPRPGYEVVPTARARALVAYLLSLNNSYAYPEARPAAPEAKTSEPQKK